MTRRWYWIGGVSLLLMAILAPWAVFGNIASMIDRSDALVSYDNVLAQVSLYRLSILMMWLVIILDLLVSWVSYLLLKQGGSSLAGPTAALRLIYTGLFAVAISYLGRSLAMGTDTVLADFLAFEHLWNLALSIFGLHLLCFGLGFWQSSLGPKWLAGLLALAGAGYLIDSLALILGYKPQISLVTFVGEVLLMAWLLWRGFRPLDNSAQVANAST